ncbi:hypothetical protein [uncultured Chryseobacterium sp.]|uniref:hypothetical protein n=1 Tax=uncultured Chryseobacterium sp. TaxID=259322 RepID=UPI0025DF6D1E|nr:hypothetical protein [uncultured Chryseobacterium sp.]
MSLLRNFANEETEKFESASDESVNNNDNKGPNDQDDNNDPDDQDEDKGPDDQNDNNNPDDQDDNKGPNDQDNSGKTVTSTEDQDQNQDKPENRGSRFANEEIARFNEYVLKTGKTWDDYQALIKPMDQMEPKDLLRQYYSEKEGMTEKEINYELGNLILDEDSEDFDFEDEKDQAKREVLLERELRKAREWREQNVSEVLSSLETPDANNMTVEEFQERMQEDQKKSVDEYRQTIYSALPDIKTMEVEVNGEKVLFTPDEEFSKNLKAITEDFGTVVNKYYDESGKLKDVAGWIDLVSWTDEKTRNAKIQFIVDQAIQRDRADQKKERRSVGNQRQTAQTSTSGDNEDFEAWREKKRSSSLD